MKTALMLPILLINGAAQLSQPNMSQEHSASGLQERTHIAIFEGCNSPVLDTRLPSRILFAKYLDGANRWQTDVSRDAEKAPLFIARCGEEFVLFNGLQKSDGGFEDVVYLRFAEDSYELVDHAWR